MLLVLQYTHQGVRHNYMLPPSCLQPAVENLDVGALTGCLAGGGSRKQDDSPAEATCTAVACKLHEPDVNDAPDDYLQQAGARGGLRAGLQCGGGYKCV
jgi:hypothetical protein